MLAIVTFAVSIAFLPVAWIPGAPNASRWIVLGLGAAVLVASLPRVSMTVGHWCGCALLSWAAASIFWSLSPWDTFGELIQIGILAIVFCYAAEADEYQMRAAWFGYALGITVSGILALLQAFELVPHAHGVIIGQGNRVAGLFLNKNVCAAAAVIALVPIIVYRWWYLLPGALICIIQPWSDQQVSRAALLMVFAAIVWAVMSVVPRFYRILAVIVAAMLIFAFLVDGNQHHRLASLNTRLAIWQIELHNTTLLGWGLGTFHYLLPMYDLGHNDWFQLAFEGGVIFIVPLVILTVYALGSAMEIERVALYAWMADSLLGYPLQTPTAAMVFALITGRLCGARRRGESASLAGALDDSGRVWRGTFVSAAAHLRSFGKRCMDRAV